MCVDPTIKEALEAEFNMNCVDYIAEIGSNGCYYVIMYEYVFDSPTLEGLVEQIKCHGPLCPLA